MKKLPYRVIDVFTDELFGGNPAGVCLLDQWLPDDMLQNIAQENNLSETAFLLRQDGYYDLRWFTPTIEIDLCGHATMASAYVLFDEIEQAAHTLKFKTLSGILTVTKENGLLCLDFPAWQAAPCPTHETLEKALGVKPVGVYKSSDFLVHVQDEQTLRSIQPDFALLMQLKAEAELTHDMFGIIVTAKGDACDFVSRFFAPNAGIDEDPVTGRAHCTLTPFWSQRLSKQAMAARQLSKRGGVLHCEHHGGERVKICGKAVRYLKGEIELEVPA